MSNLPLAGYSIISFEQYGAGPFGTMLMAKLGADVIKVENPATGGDVSRRIGPYFIDGDDETSNSLFYQSMSLNKRSFTLDLSKPESRPVLLDLVKGKHALVTNLRGDVPDRLGLTYGDLAAHNPALVCAHISAFGRSGERANHPGYDYMMQGEAGYFHLTGEPDTSPTRFGLSIVDFMTGQHMAIALLSALLRSRETGKGCDVDVNLFDTALYNLNYVALWQLNAGHNQQRTPRSAHFYITPSQLYKTKDGWIYLMCSKNKFWQLLCELTGQVELLNDPRFITLQDRFENRELLTEILDRALSRKTTEEWMGILTPGLPAGPVYDVEQALQSPYVRNNGNILPVQLNNGKEFKVLKSPIKCGSEGVQYRPAPGLGEHTSSILSELCYDDKQIRELKAKKVI